MRLAGLLLVPALALLLLGAHLVHAGLEAAAVALLLIALLFVRHPWSARTLQVVLALAVVEWLLTAAALARARIQHDEPYLRLVLILGGVAVFTAAAAVVFRHPRLRAYFGQSEGTRAVAPTHAD